MKPIKNILPILLASFLIHIPQSASQATARESGPRLRNSIGASYSGYRAYPFDQYIGAGIEYRYMHRSWIGVQLQGTDCPQLQEFERPTFGGAMVQADAVLLAGHRWGRVSVLEESGFGVLRSHVFAGTNTQFQNIYAVRNYPEVLVGGFIDVAIARRWSVTFEGRDNMVFIAPGVYSTPVPPYQLATATGSFNGPEGRAGFAFHF